MSSISTIIQRMAQAANRIGSVLEMASGAFCVICFVAMTIVALLGVFFRYVLNTSFMWTEETARYLMVWMGFVAISIALRQDRHIKVNVLSAILPPIAVRICGYLVDILIGVFMGFVAWRGWLMASGTIMSASAFPLSMFWVLLAIPLGATLTLLQLAVRIMVKIDEDVACSTKPVTDERLTR